MGVNIKYTGPQIDEAIAKIIDKNVMDTGCIRLPCSIQAPILVDTLKNPGYFLLEHYYSKRELPFTHKPLLIHIVMTNGAVVQMVSYLGQIYHRTFNATDNTWGDWSSYTGFTCILVNAVAPSTTYYPTYTIWIDVSTPAMPSLKILIKEPTPAWKELGSSAVLLKSTYDTKNKNTDIFKYIDDAIATVEIGKISEDLSIHLADTNIHTTASEKADWNSRVTNADIISALASLDSIIKQYVMDQVPVLQSSANATANATNALKTQVTGHITNTSIHPSPASVEEWNAKASGNHKHLVGDGTVSIDASKVVSGILNTDRIPPEAIFHMLSVDDDAARFALTKTAVQNGDSVYVKPPYSAFYYVIDDTKLNSADGYKLYSTSEASKLNWSDIENTPTTLLGYGITDAYTKTENDTELHALKIIGDDLTKSVDLLNTKIAGLVDASGNPIDIAALSAELTKIAVNLAAVEAQYSIVLDAAPEIYRLTERMYALTQ